MVTYPTPERSDRLRLGHYAFSCGLLLLPAIVWNLVFTNKLLSAHEMSEFWRDVPAALGLVENSLRGAVFLLPFAMPLELDTLVQRRGMAIFAAGTLVYVASWLPLMYWPHSAWSRSALGALGPAYTPALWLIGLSLLGRRLFWGRAYRWWMYLLVAAGFLAAHITHAAWVHVRTSASGRYPSPGATASQARPIDAHEEEESDESDHRQLPQLDEGPRPPRPTPPFNVSRTSSSCGSPTVMACSRSSSLGAPCLQR